MIQNVSVAYPTFIRKMASAANVPVVDIDPEGVFKYILINLYDKNRSESEPQKVLVRGYKRCNYHSDIFDEVSSCNLSKEQDFHSFII